MGLFDKVVSGVVKGLMKNVDPAAIPGLVSQYLGKTEIGSVAGLLDRLRAAGLGPEVDSWLGPGPNLPVSPEQLRAAIGEPALEQFAAATGLSIDKIMPLMATYLPQTVDLISPEGVLVEPPPSSEEPPRASG
jgi:uncharacterized protein YidB (DUF937 family)